MFLFNKNIIATKTESIKNYQQGSVIIQDKEVLLIYNAYRKRIKVYSSYLSLNLDKEKGEDRITSFRVKNISDV